MGPVDVEMIIAVTFSDPRAPLRSPAALLCRSGRSRGHQGDEYEGEWTHGILTS
jgi:hypothetical protein